MFIETSAKTRQGIQQSFEEVVFILPGRRVAATSKRKMHSLRCNWAWFQQNLCANLCALRFDEHGNCRPSPPSPSTVLPPAMADVWQHWRQKGGRGGDRDRMAATADRLTRGESVVG